MRYIICFLWSISTNEKIIHLCARFSANYAHCPKSAQLTSWRIKASVNVCMIQQRGMDQYLNAKHCIGTGSSPAIAVIMCGSRKTTNWKLTAAFLRSPPCALQASYMHPKRAQVFSQLLKPSNPFAQWLTVIGQKALTLQGAAWNLLRPVFGSLDVAAQGVQPHPAFGGESASHVHTTSVV